MSLMVAGWHAGRAGVERLYRRADRALLEQTDTGNAAELGDRPERKRNTCHSRRRAGTGWCVGRLHRGVRHSDHDQP